MHEKIHSPQVPDAPAHVQVPVDPVMRAPLRRVRLAHFHRAPSHLYPSRLPRVIRFMIIREPPLSPPVAHHAPRVPGVTRRTGSRRASSAPCWQLHRSASPDSPPRPASRDCRFSSCQSSAGSKPADCRPRPSPNRSRTRTMNHPRRFRC